VETVDIALTLPTRNVAHVARLLDLKLDALSAMQEAGFGFEAVGLAVTRAEPIPARQIELIEDAGGADRTERCATLIDTLRGRLGPHSVRQVEPMASHIPERAEMLSPVTGDAAASSWPEPEQKTDRRPLLLLPHAEPTEVTALVPDGPPRRFCWRGVTYEVAGAQGPERIAAEWWRRPFPNPPPPAEEGWEREPTRDYYLVEDAAGHRFWLFREGLYGRETTSARWFVHGLFA
jgi:protein ImuB